MGRRTLQLALGAATLCVVAASAAAAVSSPTQVWGRRLTGPGFDGAAATVFSPDGSKVFVTGSTTSAAGDSDLLTVAYDAATGSTLWTRQYDGPAHGADAGARIAVSPDGSRVIVAGTSAGSGSDYVTIAYDPATGQRLWLQRFDSTYHGDDVANGLALGGSRVFVTGASDDANHVPQYATVAYDLATGAPLWIRRFAGPTGGANVAYAAAATPDGTKVFVTGEGAKPGNADAVTIAYDAATGTDLWTARYFGPARGDDAATALAVSADGSSLYVAGFANRNVPSGATSQSDDFATVAYDASTGTERWSRTYDGPGYASDEINGVAVSPDGSRVFVTGPSSSPASRGTRLDWVTIAYSSTGTQAWFRRYAAPSGLDDDPWAIAATPDGTKVVVTGWTTRAVGGRDYLTLAYTAPQGTLIWQRRNDGVGNGHDESLAVALSLDGSRAVVTGESTGSGTGYDWSTLEYTTG